MPVEGSNAFTINTPKEFSFEECLIFLKRSPDEVLHVISNGRVLKLLEIENEFVLISLSMGRGRIKVEVLNSVLNKVLQSTITNFVINWFDLKTKLKPFYILAENDKVMKDLKNRYYGLRIMGIPDLFEAITWAIIGQHINLKFAYKLKKRFVEQYGKKYTYDRIDYFLFPSREVVLNLKPEELMNLQFTRKKAEHIINLSKVMIIGYLSKDSLLSEKELTRVKNRLLEIKGVGDWTMNYVLMKCLNINTAYPIEDVGLHNAIRIQYNLEKKPTVDKIVKLFNNWKGWEAYATFYLWRSLI